MLAAWQPGWVKPTHPSSSEAYASTQRKPPFAAYPHTFGAAVFHGGVDSDFDAMDIKKCAVRLVEILTTIKHRLGCFAPENQKNRRAGFFCLNVINAFLKKSKKMD